MLISRLLVDRVHHVCRVSFNFKIFLSAVVLAGFCGCEVVGLVEEANGANVELAVAVEGHGKWIRRM